MGDALESNYPAFKLPTKTLESGACLRQVAATNRTEGLKDVISKKKSALKEFVLLDRISGEKGWTGRKSCDTGE